MDPMLAGKDPGWELQVSPPGIFLLSNPFNSIRSRDPLLARKDPVAACITIRYLLLSYPFNSKRSTDPLPARKDPVAWGSKYHHQVFTG
jgi:hypothetical protein